MLKQILCQRVIYTEVSMPKDPTVWSFAAEAVDLICGGIQYISMRNFIQ